MECTSDRHLAFRSVFSVRPLSWVARQERSVGRGLSVARSVSEGKRRTLLVLGGTPGAQRRAWSFCDACHFLWPEASARGSYHAFLQLGHNRIHNGNSPRPSLAIARSGSCHPDSFRQYENDRPRACPNQDGSDHRTDESCGFASQTSAMSGPPELLWPEASARGSRRALPQLGRRSSNHALHSRTLAQGRATRTDFPCFEQGRPRVFPPKGGLRLHNPVGEKSRNRQARMSVIGRP